jgi:hypothetical protein
MADSLKANFFSSNNMTQHAVPGDTVTFKFASPPPTATGVLISVFETVLFLDGSTKVIDRFVGGFRGRITNGVFRVDEILGAPPRGALDPIAIRLATSLSPDSPHFWAQMSEPELIQSHTLRLRVEGTAVGCESPVDGTSTLLIEYPLAEIVPSIPMPHDPDFAILESWVTAQWKTWRPTLRHVEHVRALRLTRPIVPADYDELISAFKACAAAKSIVVALATGHGDGGAGAGDVAWCNIVPEDFPPPIPPARNLYKLDIDASVLGDGALLGHPGVTAGPPSGSSKIKLDALDRLCDALDGSSVCRILLHTCTAGQSQLFMQQFADRLQVPLLAHTGEVEHIGSPGSGNILAHYVGDATVTPRDLHHWPVSKLVGPVRPGQKPRRFGP